MERMKQQILQYMLDTYGAEAEYPWMTSPDTAVFRHPRSGKWFAVLMGNLPTRCLGLTDGGTTDVLNLKCDPIMTFSLIDGQRIFRAYHMNKEHWISLHLGSGMTMEEAVFLIDVSYGLVSPKAKPQKTGSRP